MDSHLSTDRIVEPNPEVDEQIRTADSKSQFYWIPTPLIIDSRDLPLYIGLDLNRVELELLASLITKAHILQSKCLSNALFHQCKHYCTNMEFHKH